ncbi:MAG: 16S rRNA (cytidine(1402)-2'-O)-methyltransferase [Planctomycetota bacterium]|jgi:16S rRNA (cytidine1402-2'-O)-methyltransferase
MGTLYVIATPIGNLEDATYRAVRVLGEVDALACEDTRRTRVLLERHDVPRPKTVFSYHEHNEEQAARRVVELLDNDAKVGLVTNAGYPGVSDPGYRAISSAIDAGHEVVALPGAGAVETALAASGLPAVSFTFKGFPPKKPGKRKKWLELDAALPHTLVFYESPQRTATLLADALAVYGDRRAAVCVELTKKFERVARGWLADLARDFAEAKIKGEVTVVIAGANEKFIRPSAT